MYAKILTPLDGSSLAERAVDHAAEIARGTGAQLILLQVVHAPLAEAPEAGQAAESAAITESAAVAMQYLRSVAERLAGTGIALRCEVLDGEPAAAILGFAHNENVDAIVMSTHGRSGLGKLIMGSVAEKVALTTRRPVMLVKPERLVLQRFDEVDTFLSAH